MKKYLAVFKIGFWESLVYRWDLFFFFLRQSLWFVAQMVLWGAVFSSRQDFKGLSFDQVLVYFAVVFLIEVISDTQIDYFLAQKISSGEISRDLLKPCSFFWFNFCLYWGKKIYRLFYIFLIFTGLALMGWLATGWSSLWLFLLVLLNAIFLSFLFRYLIGILAFWLITTDSILWLLRQIGFFLGGGWLPLVFFPNLVQRVIRSLPFYLMVGFPAETFQNRLSLSEITGYLYGQILWILLLFFLTYYLFRAGLKKYEAVGI